MTVSGFIIMGVSGCGKSTIARLLAKKMNWDFYDADDFHSPENLDKMASGIPLNDSDRVPWLATLKDTLTSTLKTDRHPVLACSALKKNYRTQLTQANPDLEFIYLKGNYESIRARLSERKEHYMKPSMLKSQFDTLEEPLHALVIDIKLTPEAIVEKIIEVFQL